MAVLVKASYLAAKFGVPHLRSAGGGSIVNISSIHGLLVAPGVLVYETGKAALIAATRQMAVEYGRDGIRVNAIAPGHIVTEGIQAGLWDQNPSGLKFLEAQYPVGRCGRPADIAAAVAFLCSEDSVIWITGHTLVVDGLATPSKSKKTSASPKPNTSKTTPTPNSLLAPPSSLTTHFSGGEGQGSSGRDFLIPSSLHLASEPAPGRGRFRTSASRSGGASEMQYTVVRGPPRTTPAYVHGDRPRVCPPSRTTSRGRPSPIFICRGRPRRLRPASSAPNPTRYHAQLHKSLIR